MKKMIMQGISFAGLSGIGWILDFCIYTGLGIISTNLVLNNMISSWMGVTFVFAFTTRKIFENKSNISLSWKYLMYLIYQCLLIFLISNLLYQINEIILLHFVSNSVRNFSGIISKILVTPVTLILNFVVMKYVIEKL